MGYKHINTLTKKGYDHKQKKTILTNDISSMNTPICKYLRKLMQKLRRKCRTISQRVILRRFYHYGSDSKPIPSTSQSNRYLYMVDVDKIINQKIGSKDDLKLRRKAMHVVNRFCKKETVQDVDPSIRTRHERFRDRNNNNNNPFRRRRRQQQNNLPQIETPPLIGMAQIQQMHVGTFENIFGPIQDQDVSEIVLGNERHAGSDRNIVSAREDIFML